MTEPASRAGPAAPRDRIPAIDEIRLLSILVVIALHLRNSQGLELTAGSDLVARTWNSIARNGVYGVYMFFVVSGFVITRTILLRTPELARLDLRSFYVRRAARILPLLLLTILLGVACSFVFAPSEALTRCVMAPSAELDGAFWTALGTFTFNWLRILRTETEGSGFGLHWNVLWSLAIEEQFYLFYPLLLRWLARRYGRPINGGLLVALGVFIGLGPISRVVASRLAPESEPLLLYNSLSAFESMAMGAALAFWAYANPIDGRRRRWAPALALAGAAGIALTYGFASLSGGGLGAIVGPTIIGLSVVSLIGARMCGRGSSWLVSKMSYFGQYSYGAYLLHGLVLFVCWDALRGQPVFFAFAIYAAATLLISGLVHRYFESPMNDLVRSRLVA